MIKTYPDLPNWIFEIEEVSAGVYQVLARSSLGQQVEELEHSPQRRWRLYGEPGEQLGTTRRRRFIE
jgi:hypothetical protein